MSEFDAVDVGAVEEFGSHEVTADAIVAFAEQFDPQPMHTDPEAAASTPFGGLIASGWHTAAITMRMLVDHAFADRGEAVGTGVDDLRWREPVRPGDVLSVRTTVVGKRIDEKGRGTVRTRVETRRQDGTVVQSMVSNAFYLEARAGQSDAAPEDGADGGEAADA
jgi:acyl dehydratase